MDNLGRDDHVRPEGRFELSPVVFSRSYEADGLDFQRRTTVYAPATTAARPHRVRLDGSGTALRTIRRSELVATTCPLNKTFSTSGPELFSTVPAEGGRPSKVEENENGTAGSVNSLTPAAGPVRNSNPKLSPPNEKSPDWKLDGWPVANPGSVGFWTTLVMTPLKSAPVRGGMLPKTKLPSSGSEPKRGRPKATRSGSCFRPAYPG